MKPSILIGVLVVLTSCQQKSNGESAETSLDALIGSWQRTNDEAGQSTYENWSKDEDNNYVGHGYTLSGVDTVFNERLAIEKLDNNWRYVVSLPNNQVVYFPFTSYSQDGFTAENEDNDFPKKIEYRYTSTGIEATVSGGGHSVSFPFEPLHSNQ